SDVVDYTPWLNSGTDTGAAAGFQGDFAYLNVDDDSPQLGSVGRIQEGVNLVTAGGTVYVWTGTYPEQVTITKDLALLGEDQATTIIQAFANMPVCFTTAAANRPIVCVMDAVATIDGFTIDGLGLGNSNNRFEGVALRNAGGTIQNNIIRDIRDEPFSGAQHGVAVYAYNTNGTPYTIHVLDNVITGFQKTAIALNTDAVTPETVDIQRNTITGAGATTVTAQNGIQVWSEPGSGLVADNTISGIAYDGLNWVATSILNYYADLDITGNTVTDAHLAIYNIDGGGLIADNDLTIIKTATYPYAYGIVATDPPQAIPSPFDPQARPDNQLTGNGTNALLGVEVANNVVTFNGTDKTGTTAIEADAAYGPNDLALNVHDNIVTGFEYGLVFYQCDPATSTTCDTGVFTAISANHNDLVGNAMGIYLGGPIPAAVVPTIHHNRIFGDGAVGLYNDLAVSVTAENNWWGCNEGPNDVAGDCDTITGTGVVDADPWLVLSAAADPTAVQPLGTSTIAADMIFNSDAADTSAAGYLPDGIPAAYTAPDGGTLSETAALTLNGTLLPTTTFTAPAADQAYQVCTAVDNELLCVDVTVQNVAPVAVDDTATTTEDTPVAILAVDLATNDTDANLDALTVTAVSNPTNGTVVLAAGTITFTPTADFNGTAGFDYTVSDGVLTDTGHVTVTVTAVNDAPVAVDNAYEMDEDTILNIEAPGVLNNDTDADGDTLTAMLVVGPTNGTLVLNADGSFTYTPSPNFFGTDAFTYKASDGTSDSNVATVTITVVDMPEPKYIYLPVILK
ncbi:MAG TPA: cadherin-like domain-containing protein, partial [Anaerolineaceae bacterium]|nr:cadherin-like domain-containing protein [Anaerolineaceae bacterium]HQH87006.1 cadherin-like domain-containing protein [Anaerolineaceae bacterium]